LSILLPVGVLLEESLGVVVEARGLSGSRSGSDVAGLVEESVDIVLQVVEVEAQLFVVLDIVGSLLSAVQGGRDEDTNLLGSLDDVVERLVGNLLDEGLEVSAGLLDLLVLVGNLGLVGSLLEGILGLVGVLLEKTDNRGDRSLVFGLLLSSLDDLSVSEMF
jgi:hypothetical protein